MNSLSQNDKWKNNFASDIVSSYHREKKLAVQLKIVKKKLFLVCKFIFIKN